MDEGGKGVPHVCRSNEARPVRTNLGWAGVGWLERILRPGKIGVGGGDECRSSKCSGVSLRNLRNQHLEEDADSKQDSQSLGIWAPSTGCLLL